MNQLEYEDFSDDSFDGERGTQLESSQMFQQMSQSQNLNGSQLILCEFCQIPTKLKRNRNGETICLNCKNIVTSLGTGYQEETGISYGNSQRHLKTIKNVITEVKVLTKEEKVKLYIGNYQKIILKQIEVMIVDLKFCNNLKFYFKEVFKSYVKKFFLQQTHSTKIRKFFSWHCIAFVYICCMLSKEDIFLSELKKYSKRIFFFKIFSEVYLNLKLYLIKQH